MKESTKEAFIAHEAAKCGQTSKQFKETLRQFNITVERGCDLCPKDPKKRYPNCFGWRLVEH
jgi:hypothetical protein